MIIVVSGKKRSGKDTFYQIAKDFLPNKKVIRYAFADPVKQAARLYFNVDETSDKESYRFVLQGIGHMMREEIDRYYWVNKISYEVDGDFRRYGEKLVAIVTDCRYLNEVEWAEFEKALLVRIVRPDLVLPDTHQSEVDLDNYHFEHVIENTGDLESYSRRVKLWLQEHVLM